MFLARYRPDPHPGAWLSLLGARPERSIPEELAGPPHRAAFRCAREALAAFFDGLPRGRVLLSAQICPVVPFLLRARGFELDFADLHPEFPCPGPEQLSAATTPDTVAVVVSPFYGLAPGGWDCYRPSARLVLDLAQGIDLLEELAPRADAVVYSFGLGKGADTGGGLLCSLTSCRSDWPRAGTAPFLRALVGALALRLLCGTPLYSRVVDRAVDHQKEDLPVQPRLAPQGMAGVWWRRLRRMRQEIRLARERYTQLPGRVEAFCSNGTHTRTILRLPATRRAEVLHRLREQGVDACPAGEPLPWEYLGTPEGDFPNARAFCAEAVRLPFLGRLSGWEFDFLARALGRALA